MKALLALLALVAVAGCESTPTRYSSRAVDVGHAVAHAVDHMPVILLEGHPAHVACGEGGEVVYRGYRIYAVRPALAEQWWDMAVTYERCALLLPSGTAEVEGVLRLTGSVRHGRAGLDGVRPLEMEESSQEGTLEYLGPTGSVSCHYAMRQSFEPIKGTYHLVGSACGDTIDERIPARRWP